MAKVIGGAILLVPLFLLPIPGLWDFYYFPKAILLWIISLSVLIFIIYDWKFFKAKIGKKHIGIVLFVLSALASTIFSTYQDTVWLGILNHHEGFFTLLSYSILLIASSIYIDKIKVKKVVFLAMISGSIVALLGILQYFQINLIPKDIIRDHWERIYSTIGNANWLGSYCILLLPLSIHFAYSKDSVVKTVPFFLIFTCLLFSGTRGAYIGFIISVFVGLFIVVKRPRVIFKLKYVLIATTISLFLGLSNNAYPYERAFGIQEEVSNGLKGDLNAGEARLMFYKLSMPLVVKYPLGSGPDTFGKVFPQNKLNNQLNSENNSVVQLNKAHNEYLQIIITIGVLGFLSFLLLILQGFRPLLNSRTYSINIAIALGILAYSVQLIFVNSSIGSATVFWIFLGIVLSLKENQIEVK